ncbi:photosynthetic reaction center subunit H [Roseospira marina]|uniref:Photosynthetic reaction center subunit H n=1 Tax=Roseospira marina TaxID=140057 RepID=A0A5M6IB62_9PROT|nr:photosynthetic reaction center subunit H [Roseospira marina]KAA5604975.1 photosynthetic reaction center subunit H [Roseospira marina]MBB4315021.1 photosynthetic reaction center H subunit [Roseospira marina]MBB5088021.1 photosynthetic reaction center H subunit [Roseospira marina]
MPIGAFTSYMDVAQVVLWVFWFFFFGLILYLRREDRREGYPLEADTTGKLENAGWLWIPPAKTFKLFHGGEEKVPNFKRDTRPLKAKRVAPWSGSPYEPTGANPLLDCIGPSAYAERLDRPELDLHNKPKIVPMRAAKGFTMESNSPDPRGMKVVGSDGTAVGQVVDLWVDTPEIMARYFEVELAGGPAPKPGEGAPAAAKKRVLLPVNFAHVAKRKGEVQVAAIPGKLFAQVPVTKKPDQVTMLEEEKICAYYGGGFLLAQ